MITHGEIKIKASIDAIENELKKKYFFRIILNWILYRKRKSPQENWLSIQERFIKDLRVAYDYAYTIK